MMLPVHVQILILFLACFVIAALGLSFPLLEPRFIRDVSVQRMPLLQQDPSAPYCFAVSSMATLLLNPSSNFLATQVWPSARLASLTVQKHVSKSWKICEFGCGPGLPSLTAASLGCSVVATDLDEFALELVQAAADEQKLNVKTRKFDLIVDGMNDPEQRSLHSLYELMDGNLDLVLFSDVFENNDVAKGAAHVTKYFLDRGSRVWTFAQSDRAQREAYVAELNRLVDNTTSEPYAFKDNEYDPSKRLWLCDLDETKVIYG